MKYIFLLKGFPCKIVDMSTSKTGKHGHAKVHLVGIDIFTGKKYEDLSPSTHNMDVPIVTKKEYQLLNITDDDYTSLLDDKGNTKDDLKVPEGDEGIKLRELFNSGADNIMVSVQKAMGQEAIISAKESSK
jgi:translation initiation factor 5A